MLFKPVHETSAIRGKWGIDFYSQQITNVDPRLVSLQRECHVLLDRFFAESENGEALARANSVKEFLESHGESEDVYPMPIRQVRKMRGKITRTYVRPELLEIEE